MFVHALANPLPPSVTTKAGGAIRLMSAPQAPRVLTPSRIPAQHAIGCLGDKHHGASAQVDAVDDNDVMDLIDDRAERP